MSASEGATTCHTCPAGAFATEGSSACTLCPSGAYGEEARASGCTLCAAGMYSETVGANTSDVCRACPAGTSSPRRGAGLLTNCTDCPRDTYSQHGAMRCEICAPKTTSASRSQNASDCLCLPGHEGPDGGSCSECAAGQFKARNGSSVCAACPEGKYSEYLIASTACNDCPLAALSPTGSSRVFQCTCIAGYNGEDGSPCTACARGTYKELRGSSPCIDCGAGYFSSALALGNRSLCRACDVGTYSSLGAADSEELCLDCIAGTYANATASSVCAQCNAGFYSTTTSAISVDACLACDAGKFSAQKAADSETMCEGCSAGTYSYAGNSFCSVCPAFSDSGPESDDPSKCLCNVGYFGAVLQDCSACPAGKYSTDVGLMQESDCLLCTAGSYSEQAWTSCLICPAGTYAPAVSPACITCPLDSYSPVEESAFCFNCSIAFCEDGLYRSR